MKLILFLVLSFFWINIIMCDRKAKWFENCFGFEESSINPDERYLEVEMEEVNFFEGVELPILVNQIDCKNGNKYIVGHFETPNIFELREKSEEIIEHLPNKGHGIVNIISGEIGIQPHLFSIIDSQAYPEHAGATFQVASNFNCLELVSNRSSVRSGISGYPYDRTQGPGASMGAYPATFYRSYLHHHKNFVGQMSHEIELLEDFNVPVQNGYILLPQNYDMNSIKDSGTIRVGNHQFVEVVFEKREGFDYFKIQNPQLIHQVFTAALNFCDHFRNEEKARVVAKKCLRASYEGTIRSAIINSQLSRAMNLPGANKVFLTLIGGGVFQNPHSDIFEAIIECKDLIVRSGLEVNLVFYSGFTTRLTEYRNFARFVQEIGGKIIKA
eukprot:TRINITY_DN2490_c0_g4_i1.p1 TRINITY_DN2490_c0_g4~~TRINITY_DN2490_c0_g4_i1.p1  ORF type:complete len:385 (-),score=100.30 TRINITY_DN2490_c0_g4_i1:105-1259(-)